MKWRSIEKDGYPKDSNKTYLVTDGKEISTTDISVQKNTQTGDVKFIKWTGDENTCEYNSCCSGEVVFELTPTHWCPTDEIEIPSEYESKESKRVKSSFMTYFDGCYDVEPEPNTCDTFVMGVSKLEYKDKTNELVVYLRRPGLLIGKAGTTIDALSRRLECKIRVVETFPINF